MTKAQRHEAYFRLYWADITDSKKVFLCHAAGLPDTVGLFRWDEMSPNERSALRVEITRRVHVSASTANEGRAVA